MAFFCYGPALGVQHHTSGGSDSVSTYAYIPFFAMQPFLCYSNARLKRIVATHCNCIASQQWIISLEFINIILIMIR